jgi:hypothetical protein
MKAVKEVVEKPQSQDQDKPSQSFNNAKRIDSNQNQGGEIPDNGLASTILLIPSCKPN